MIEHLRLPVILLAPLLAQVSSSSSSHRRTQGFFDYWQFFEPCHICGDGFTLTDKDIRNEDAMIPSWQLTCNQMYWAGRAGILDCGRWLSEVEQVCGCNDDNQVYVNSAKPLTLGGPSLIDMVTKGTMSQQQFIVSCDQKNEFMLTYGIWYKYIARSSGFVTIANCGTYSGVIDVYQPMQSSSGLFFLPSFSCVPGEVKGGENCNNVSWEANRGEEYAILVSGPDPASLTQRNPTVSVSIVDNRRCEFSIGPVDVDTIIPVTRKAAKTPIFVPVCNGSNTQFYIGGLDDDLVFSAWYKVVGSGSLVNISTCSSSAGGIVISILSGSSCKDYSCVDIKSSTSCDVTFSSNLNQTYYVLLYGKYEHETFDLEISSVGEGAENGSCDSAEALALQTTGQVPFRSGFPISSATAVNFPACASATPYIHELWFKVAGTVGSVNLLALSISSSHLLDIPIDYIQVFSASEDCEQLDCVPNIGHYVSCASKCSLIVDFPVPSVGEKYYIVISTADRESIDLEHGLQYEFLSI